jgi:tRNA-specific 2-thiouridylase
LEEAQLNNHKAVVAMSGGVDSSVAAYLLKNQGYDLVGITMKLWDQDGVEAVGANRGCCTVDDIEDARRVCQLIDIPHYVVNFQKEFQEHVIDYFCSEYQQGRTPYPCLACNDKIKFDFLMRQSQALGFDYIATGHYARMDYSGPTPRLFSGVDRSKDQSYVLFNLRPNQAQNLLLPLGDYDKYAIRDIARNAGLPVADKLDSQDICFIPQNDYRAFISERFSPSPGDIVDSLGKVLGKHKGIEFFTVGQRRGIGIQEERPLFVLAIDRGKSRVIVGYAEELMQDSIWASNVNYISGFVPSESMEVNAKIRYKALPSPATVTPHGDWAEIKFHEPQRAITPGQAVVFYDDNEVLGGGFIEGLILD